MPHYNDINSITTEYKNYAKNVLEAAKTQFLGMLYINGNPWENVTPNSIIRSYINSAKSAFKTLEHITKDQTVQKYLGPFQTAKAVFGQQVIDKVNTIVNNIKSSDGQVTVTNGKSSDANSLEVLGGRFLIDTVGNFEIV